MLQGGSIRSWLTVALFLRFEFAWTLRGPLHSCQLWLHRARTYNVMTLEYTSLVAFCYFSLSNLAFEAFALRLAHARQRERFVV